MTNILLSIGIIMVKKYFLINITSEFFEKIAISHNWIFESAPVKFYGILDSNFLTSFICQIWFITSQLPR